MADFEKVVRGMECCISAPYDCGHKCPYFEADGCIAQLKIDALSLLKTQEPVPVGEKVEGFCEAPEFYSCGFCKNAIRKPWGYCPFCGKPVKWHA